MDNSEISTTDIRDNLADALNRVAYGKERLVLKRRNKIIAALVPVDDLEVLEELEHQADIRAAKKARKENKWVPVETVKKRLGMK